MGTWALPVPGLSFATMSKALEFRGMQPTQREARLLSHGRRDKSSSSLPLPGIELASALCLYIYFGF